MADNQTERYQKHGMSEKNIIMLDFDRIESFSYTAFAYTKPVSFSYFDERKNEVSSWKGLYVQVLTCLLEDYPEKLYKLYNTNINGGNRVDFGTFEVSKNMVCPRKISADFYAETSLCASAIIKKIRILMDKCNIDYENLQIKYRKLSQNAEEVNESADKTETNMFLTEKSGTENAEIFKKWMVQSQNLVLCDAVNYASAIYDCEQLAKLLILSENRFYGSENKMGRALNMADNQTERYQKHGMSEKNIIMLDFDRIESFSYTAFAYTKPVSFSYFDERKNEVSSWKGLYVQVLTCLLEDYPEKLYKLYNTNINGGNRVDFGTFEVSKNMVCPRKISADFYAETSLCASAIIKKIRILMDKCNIDYENLQIKYRKLSQNAEEVNESADKTETNMFLTEKSGTENAEIFKKWMVQSQNLVLCDAVNYASAIYDCEQLAKLLILSENRFYGSDLESVLRLRTELTQTVAFKEIDARQHYRLGIAMENYEMFLRSENCSEVPDNKEIKERDKGRFKKNRKVLD